MRNVASLPYVKEPEQRQSRRLDPSILTWKHMRLTNAFVVNTKHF